MNPAGPATPEARRRLAVLALGGAAVLAALYVAAIGSTGGRRIDAALLGEPIRDGLVLGVSGAIVDRFDMGVALLAAAGLLLLARVHGDRRTALVLLAGLGGAVASARLLKELLGRLDPTGGENARAVGDGFYPSGHSTMAMALVLVAVVLAPTARSRLAAVVVGGAGAGAIGASHALTASHLTSDVAGGFLLAFAWLATSAALVSPRGMRCPRPPRALAALGTSVALTAAIAACSLAGAGAAVSRTLGVVALTALSLWLAGALSASLAPAEAALQRRTPSQPGHPSLGRVAQARPGEMS